MTKARVIFFHYTLTDRAGVVIDSSKGKDAFAYMEGAHQIIPGLEEAMKELKKGDKKKILVAAAQAYGIRNESMVVKVPREKLPPTPIKIGDRFRGGEEHNAPVFTVTHISEKEVTLDGNHSLAGQDLTFDVELIDMREATAEELSHGHAHGGDGHSH